MQTEQTRSRKGKKPSKASQTTEKKLQEIAEKAAAKTISKMNRKVESIVDESFDEASEIEEDNSINNIFSGSSLGLSETEEDQEVVDNDQRSVEEIEESLGDFDIFDFGAREAAKRGDMPKFRIYRSGEFLCVKHGQYSYERLQKDYKGGHYKIYAYSNVTNKYLKAQSKMIADPFEQTPTSSPEVQAQAASNNVAEMILAMKDVFGVKAQGEAEEIRAKTDSSATMMTMMMQMMQQSTQMQMQMIQQQAKESQRMMEFMLTLSANKPKEDKGMNTMELIALLEKSKSKGAAEFKELFSMAKELAEDMRGEDPGGEEKSGIIDSLIKNLGPLVNTIAQQAQAPQPQVQAPRINPQLAASVPTTIPQAIRQPAPEAPVITAQPGMPQSIKETGRQAPGPLGIATINEQEDEEDEGEEIDQELEGLDSDLNEGESYLESEPEAPLVNPDKITVVKRASGVDVVSVKPQASNKPEAKDQILNAKDISEKGDNMDVRSRVMNLLASDLVKAALMGGKPELLAPKAFTKLKSNGITGKMILDNFSEEIILKAAIDKGLPEKYKPMLKEFYAHIENFAKRDAGTV